MPSRSSLPHSLALLALLLSAGACSLAERACRTCDMVHEELRFADRIERFEHQDARNPPPKGTILFIGSSSFVRWRTLAEDMAPLPVFNRAFGGSRTWEAIHYLDRVVIPYEPRIIAYYEGDNDLSRPEAKAKATFAGFRTFARRVHKALPGTHIFFVSIKPSPKRWAFWPEARKANALIKRFCEGDGRLHYVDATGPLLDKKGVVREEQFESDRLHFKPEVYREWTKILKPQIEKAWKEQSSAETRRKRRSQRGM